MSALFRQTRYSVTKVKELRFFQNVLTLGTDALVLGHGHYVYSHAGSLQFEIR